MLDTCAGCAANASDSAAPPRTRSWMSVRTARKTGDVTLQALSFAQFTIHGAASLQVKYIIWQGRYYQLEGADIEPSPGAAIARPATASGHPDPGTPPRLPGRLRPRTGTNRQTRQQPANRPLRIGHVQGLTRF